jgi:hypothetical protein
MIDSERGRSNTNVPFHLPDALEYKFLGCIPDHHQSRMVSNGIAMAVQAGLGWGGVEAQRKCVRCIQGWCCGFVFDGVDSCRDVPQYKVMKYLVFGIISSSLLSELLF